MTVIKDNKVELKLETGKDVIDYTQFKIGYRKPDGTLGEWVASADVDQTIKAEVEFDTEGQWDIWSELYDGVDWRRGTSFLIVCIPSPVDNQKITNLNLVKLLLGITTSDYDAKITALIPLVESDYLKIRNIPFDEQDGVISYPSGSDVTAAEMVGYRLATSAKNWTGNYGKVVSAEGLDNHSISFDTSAGEGGANKYGYPKGIISSIETFIDGR